MYIRPSACLSAWSNSAPTGKVLMKLSLLSIFRKSLWKIQISLKADENNGQFTWRPACLHLHEDLPAYIYDSISQNSSYNEQLIRQML